MCGYRAEILQHCTILPGSIDFKHFNQQVTILAQRRWAPYLGPSPGQTSTCPASASQPRGLWTPLTTAALRAPPRLASTPFSRAAGKSVGYAVRHTMPFPSSNRKLDVKAYRTFSQRVGERREREREILYIYVCVYVCLYVCMHACMSVCMFVCLYSVCMYVCMSICLYVCMSVMSVCLYDCVSACLYVCMSVCLYVCMCVYVYVCICVCVYICVYMCPFVYV